MDQTPYLAAWPDLWNRISHEAQRLSALQEKVYTEWRVGKLVGLRDAELTFFDLDQQVHTTLDPEEAWGLYTTELVHLHARALDLNTTAYAAGIELGLQCQQGHHPAIDIPPLESFLNPVGP